MPLIVLAAHGTRDPSGAAVTERLARRVRLHAPGAPVRVAYADVRGPDVTTVLRSCAEPAVVVPAFLASGYHVRSDIPAQIAASKHGQVRVSAALGAAPELIELLEIRLRAAGYIPGDVVVLAAAGSSDRRALSEVRDAAAQLAGRLGTRVRVGHAASAIPSVAEARVGGNRVAVASWLLAPGLFQRALLESGADLVAEPLGAAECVARLVLRRYTEAMGLLTQTQPLATNL